MTVFSRRRFGLLGIAVFVCCCGRADGEWLRRLRSDCHPHDVQRDVVRLPSREVVVETERPRVIVHESRERSLRAARGPLFAQPVVATLFTPVALPVGPMFSTGERSFESRSADFSALRSIHDLEHQVLEVERVRAAHNAERQAIDRAFQRVARSVNGDSLSSDRSAKEERVQKLQKLEAELQKVTDRLDKVEKLVIIHDEILKKKVPLKD